MASKLSIKSIVIILPLLSALNSFSQSIDFDKIIQKDFELLFIGEHHAIEENHIMQLALVSNLIEKGEYNSVILEKPTSHQYIIDNILQKGDTTGLYLLLPKSFCSKKNCIHNYEPLLTFVVDLCKLSMSSTKFSIHCVDTEFDFLITKKIISLIIHSELGNNGKAVKPFDRLESLKSEIEIRDELLVLYNSIDSWKNDFSASNFKYLDEILSSVALDYKYPHNGFLREEYLFEKINTLKIQNPSIIPIAIFGIKHTYKYFSTKTISDPRESVAYKLNTQRNSKFKRKVGSIGTTYFFKHDADSVVSKSGIFNYDDLSKIFMQSENDSITFVEPKVLGLNEKIIKSFDFVIGLKDCTKLIQKMEFYPKNDPLKSEN